MNIIWPIGPVAPSGTAHGDRGPMVYETREKAIASDDSVDGEDATLQIELGPEDCADLLSGKIPDWLRERLERRLRDESSRTAAG